MGLSEARALAGAKEAAENLASAVEIERKTSGAKAQIPLFMRLSVGLKSHPYAFWGHASWDYMRSFSGGCKAVLISEHSYGMAEQLAEKCVFGPRI
jgi:hypothetical protein